MKQEKGITTTSVIIYVIAVLIVISTLSTLSIYFNKQIKEGMKKQENIRRMPKIIYTILSLKTLCYHNKLKCLSILHCFVPTFKTRRFFLRRLPTLHLSIDTHFSLSN